MRHTSFPRTFIARAFLVCCIQVLFLLQCSGQSTLGSIFGTITDSSGAVVPEAGITVTNVHQGTTRTAKTAPDGTYRISQLAPGTYQVVVEHQGFAKSQSEQITLAIESSVRADLMLKPGNQSTTVEVSAANALMEVGSAEVSTQVTTEELHDLPSIDRNILGLMSLGPGTVAGNDTGRVGLISGAEVVAMGTPPVGNTFLLDGVATNMEFSGTVAAKPPMDTAAGFSTQIAQFPADLGRAAGAVLNMSIKSGTNKFHGAVYEYIQNDIANASNYNFQTVAQPVLPYRRNQFGANLGGPIIHDKAFFFVGWEGLHQLTTTRTQYTVPTAAEKNGDFRASGDFAGYAVYDPASLPAGATTGNRTRFANDVIPASRITSIGKALMQWYPEPNYQTRFYLQDVRKTVDSNSWVGKVNFTINPHDSVDVHYVQQSQAWRGSNLNAAVSSTTTQQNGINTGINYIHIFSPLLLNTLRLSYSRFYLPSIADNQTNYMNAIGIPGWANDPGTPGVPTLSVATMSAIQAYQAVSAFAINFKLKENNYQIQDLVNWQRGRHSFKIGAEYQQVRTWQFRTRTGGGNLTFNGTQTTQTPTSSVASPRDGVADALLALASGVTARYQLSNGSSLRSHYVMPYIQDDWRLTDRLTINLGLRYGIFTPYIVANDITWNFDPSTGTVIVPNSATSKAFFQNSLGFTNGLPARWAYVAPDQVYKKTQWNDFDPRIGFAYQVRPNIVWRGGFGLYHLPVLANTPMNGTADSNDYVPSISTGNPLDLTKGVPTGGLTATLSSTGFTPYFYPRNIPDPYSEKWTMDVQYSPTRNSLVGVGYLGANSLHFAEIYPFNQAPVVSTTVALGSRTPYPNFGQFYSYDQVDRVNYNAGTARFELNGFHGLLFKSYYTYAKALGIGTGNDQVLVSPYNSNYDYGRVDYDVKHRWTTTFVYRMPSPRDAGLWTKILSPWDLSGIINLQSGMPMTVTDSGGTALNIGTTGGSGQRPQLLHNPNLPTDQRSKSKWFDTTAFAHVSWCTGAPADVDSYTTTAFAIGDATNPCRNITAVAANSRIVARTATTMAIPWGNEGKAVIDGPGQRTFNLAIQRRFLLPMESALTFRLEAINALNHPNLHAPSGLNFSGTNFGVILATQNPMRQLQASIRIDF